MGNGEAMSIPMSRMSIEFLADDNPLYVLPFFEEFIKNYAAEFTIKRISLCKPMGKRSRIQLLKQLTALYGPIGMVRILSRFGSARCLGIFPKGRNAKRFHTLSQLCRAYGIVCDRTDNPNSDDFCDGMSGRGTDLLISVACPFILKPPLLNTPPLGCINIHHAPLPKYKGMMPTFWQMFHRESKVGVTIHYMEEKIDDGRAILQDELVIDPQESLDHLIKRAKKHGAHCMARVLRLITHNEQVPVPLNKAGATYFTFPTSAQMVEFRRRGLRAL